MAHCTFPQPYAGFSNCVIGNSLEPRGLAKSTGWTLTLAPLNPEPREPARGFSSRFLLHFPASRWETSGARRGEAEQARLGKPTAHRGTASRGDLSVIVRRQAQRRHEERPRAQVEGVGSIKPSGALSLLGASHSHADLHRDPQGVPRIRTECFRLPAEEARASPFSLHSRLDRGLG